MFERQAQRLIGQTWSSSPPASDITAAGAVICDVARRCDEPRTQLYPVPILPQPSCRAGSV